jgi:hypothetical protein
MPFILEYQNYYYIDAIDTTISPRSAFIEKSQKARSEKKLRRSSLSDCMSIIIVATIVVATIIDILIL